VANFLQGYLGTSQGSVEAVNDITVCVRNWYQNLNPLVTRLSNIPVDRPDFQLWTHQYRAGSTTLGVAIASNATTGITVTDASSYQNHDVLQWIDSASGNSEYVQVNGDPLTGTTLNVLRGVGGTTPLTTVTINSTINLIGSSRTGAEVNQTALTTLGTSTTQYCQTFQHAVQIGGSAETTRAVVLPGGIQSPFGFNQTMQLQNHVNDIERTMMYGLAEAPNLANTVTAKMAGLRSLLITNNTTNPTNAGAYGSVDLIRDTLQACRTNGGDPDVLFVSTNFMSGFATWGHAVQRLSAGATEFGTPIKILKAPFLDDITIVEAPLLRPFSAFCINAAEVYTRWKRQIYWNQRGNRGDMLEGEWISEPSIQVENQFHHAWVEGITAFSAN
jgi:Family of unknown function (DUF5309)